MKRKGTESGRSKKVCWFLKYEAEHGPSTIELLSLALSVGAVLYAVLQGEVECKLQIIIPLVVIAVLIGLTVFEMIVRSYYFKAQDTQSAKAEKRQSEKDGKEESL